MVYDLGVISPLVVEKLKGVLVVTPEECSKAGGPVVDIDFGFRELIFMRKESWVSIATRRKIIQLKLMFVGRGADMNQVINSYCEFLHALEKRKRKKTLEKLLNNADEIMQIFVKKYGDYMLNTTNTYL